MKRRRIQLRADSKELSEELKPSVSDMSEPTIATTGDHKRLSRRTFHCSLWETSQPICWAIISQIITYLWEKAFSRLRDSFKRPMARLTAPEERSRRSRAAEHRQAQTLGMWGAGSGRGATTDLPDLPGQILLVWKVVVIFDFDQFWSRRSAPILCADQQKMFVR